MIKLKRLYHNTTKILTAAVLLTGFATQDVFALTQQDLYRENIYAFNLAQDCGISEGATSSPTNDQNTTGGGKLPYLPQIPLGTSSEQQIWYFFTKEVGLSPEGTAGIMGNIQAESGFNPASEQHKGAWEDMSSNNVNHGGKGGVGLVQWDGGRRPAYINYAAAHNADKKSIVPQLNYVWKELNSDYTKALTSLQSADSPEDAAYAFHKYYEISNDSEDRIRTTRMAYARRVYNQYFGKDITGTTPTTSSDNKCGDEDNNLDSSVGVQCNNATGNARILCAAKYYDTTSYLLDYTGGHQGAQKWHKDCDTTYHYLNGKGAVKTINGNWAGPKCVLDCSGLVNISVFDIFKVDINENTGGERADIGKYWKKISFSELKAGDIVQPHSSHVEIVDHVEGTKIVTFGAHTNNNRPQPDQVGPGGFRKSAGQLYLRYIGPGGA